jgi:hypothetical protein
MRTCLESGLALIEEKSWDELSRARQASDAGAMQMFLMMWHEKHLLSDKLFA